MRRRDLETEAVRRRGRIDGDKCGGASHAASASGPRITAAHKARTRTPRCRLASLLWRTALLTLLAFAPRRLVALPQLCGAIQTIHEHAQLVRLEFRESKCKRLLWFVVAQDRDPVKRVGAQVLDLRTRSAARRPAQRHQSAEKDCRNGTTTQALRPRFVALLKLGQRRRWVPPPGFWLIARDTAS